MLDIPLLFSGCGDARNVYAALASIGLREDDSERNFGSLHITMLDLKHAALAKALILFNMMHLVDEEMMTKGPHPTDYFLVMAYVFACQVIPPFVQKKLQSNIQDLIERLENKEEPLSFIYLHACDTEAVIRVLRQWQSPWPAISKPAHVRKVIKDQTPSPGPLAPKKGPDGPEKIDYKKFAAVFPSQALARQWEPSLADTLAEYKKTGKGEELLQQIDLTWAVNNTLIDYDFADHGLNVPGGSFPHLEYDPLEMVSATDFASRDGQPDKAKKNNAIDRLADLFRVHTISTIKLHSQKRLTVEMIVGEMTDIIERIRYNALTDAPTQRTPRPISL